MLLWDVYEIRTQHTPIQGVMLRGRIRKYCLQQKIDVLCENARDEENTVRFAILHNQSPKKIVEYLQTIIEEVTTNKILENINNPVLSKLKINKEERYTL